MMKLLSVLSLIFIVSCNILNDDSDDVNVGPEISGLNEQVQDDTNSQKDTISNEDSAKDSVPMIQQDSLKDSDFIVTDDSTDMTIDTTVLSDYERCLLTKDSLDSVYNYQDSVEAAKIWKPSKDSSLILDEAYSVLFSNKQGEPFLLSLSASSDCFWWYCPPTDAKVYPDGLVLYRRGGTAIDRFEAAFYINDSEVKQIDSLANEFQKFHEEKLREKETSLKIVTSDIVEYTLANSDGVKYIFDTVSDEENGVEKVSEIYQSVSEILDLSRFPLNCRSGVGSVECAEPKFRIIHECFDETEFLK